METSDSSVATEESEKRKWREPEEVEATMRGFWRKCEALREETREGEDHEECGSNERGFGLREWISMEEASESKSKSAKTANRSNADCRGSQRTASTYLCWGNLCMAVAAIARV